MPDPSTSHDDPFAELFSKLPDPRERASAPQAAPSAPQAAPSRPQSQDADVAPTSRRAAREAARAPETGAAVAPAAPPVPPPPAGEPVAAPVVRPQPTATPAQQPAQPRLAFDGPAAAQASGPARPVSTAPTLDDLFTDAAHEHPSTTPKRKRRIGGWIALGVVLVLIGGVVGGGFWVWNTYEDKIREVMGWEEPKDYEAGLAHGEAMVTIAQGDIPSTISKSLYEAGVTKTGSAFYDMLIDSGQNPTFYPGVYKLQKQMSAAAALKALEDPANKLENSALVREGLTMDQILPILSDSLGIPLEDFQAAVKNPADYGVTAGTLEGWLFPAMYTFDPGVTAKDVIAKMVARTVQSLDTAEVPEDQRERILNIASIIQREARLEDDFYKVSRVIYNRLDQGWQLQMDSTAQYGYGELHDGTVSSSGAALDDDNAWNTYKIQGLPKTPISNPGDVAIDAAMHPAKGDWMFFVTWNLDTGETIFSKTDAEHEKAKQKWISWCKQHPDSGC